jgi:ribosomal protein S27AE
MRELEDRVERLEDELRWLRRAVEVNGQRTGAKAVGRCPNCNAGVLTASGSELRCSSCGYAKFL